VILVWNTMVGELQVVVLHHYLPIVRASHPTPVSANKVSLTVCDVLAAYYYEP